MNDHIPGGQVYEAMLSVLTREVWPRTLADIGVSRTVPYDQLVEIANREVPEGTVPNHRIILELLCAAEQVCETNSSESKEKLAAAVLDARAFNEWNQFNRVKSLASAKAKAEKEDPLDTKLTMSGGKASVEFNLGHAPSNEQMVEAVIAGAAGTIGLPDLNVLLTYFRDGAAYLEKRIAKGDTRRLRVVTGNKKDQEP